MPPELLPLAVLVAIAPGYLTIYFATHGRTGQPVVPDLRLVLQSLVISAVLLAILGPFAYASLWPQINELDKHLWLFVGWTALLFLIAPYAIGRTAQGANHWLHRYRDTRLAQAFRLAFPAAIPPTIWDWSSLEGLHESRFVVIEFTDGKRIGGAYGKPGVVLTSPEEHGIFLVAEWTLNEAGIPIERVAASEGVLVPLDRDVRSVRFFAGEAEEKPNA